MNEKLNFEKIETPEVPLSASIKMTPEATTAFIEHIINPVVDLKGNTVYGGVNLPEEIKIEKIIGARFLIQKNSSEFTIIFNK